MMHSRNHILHVHKSEYISSLSYENYKTFQSLFASKHCLVLHTLFPTNSKIRHGPLKFRVANFKGIRYTV